MESKLVKNRNDVNKKIALIMYEDINNLNSLYRKLLQLNGYQIYLNNINISGSKFNFFIFNFSKMLNLN